jgi:hypothetical protein
MRNRWGGRSRGFVLAVVLGVLFVLVLLVFILISTGRESYNQVAVAAAGTRADLLARSAVDEARDKLAGWLGLAPYRGLERPGFDPLIGELVKKVQRHFPTDEFPGPTTGSVWETELDLTAFYARRNLVEATQKVVEDEGFKIAKATVDFHSFHRTFTRLSDGKPIEYYYMVGSEERQAPPVDYLGLATFRVTVKSGLAGLPVERTYVASYDLALSNYIPIAKQFALFAFAPTPGFAQFNPAEKDAGRKTGAAWDDLNQNERVKSGALRVHPTGGRVFMNGPYVVDSTGWPAGNAPSYRGATDNGLIGPGVVSEFHWDLGSYSGFGGVPAPRAGIMTPRTMALSPMPPFDNARPAHRHALYEALFTDQQAMYGAACLVDFDPRPVIEATKRGVSPLDSARDRIKTQPDPGVKLVKGELFKLFPQHWFTEFAAMEGADKVNVEHRAFSLFGDPRHGQFSAYTGRFVRFSDNLEKDKDNSEDFGLMPPRSDKVFENDGDLAAVPDDAAHAWVKLPPREGRDPAVQPLLNEINLTESFIRTPKAVLPAVNSFLPEEYKQGFEGALPTDEHGYAVGYNRRRFGVIPEGQVYLRTRLAKFDRPLFMKVIKFYRQLLMPWFAISSLEDWNNVLFLLGTGYPWYTMDAYNVGEQCDKLDSVPNVPQSDTAPSPDQLLDQARTFMVQGLRNFENYLECWNAIEDSPLPNEVVHYYGAHWQPLVIYDTNSDAKMIGMTVVAGLFAAVVAIGVAVIVVGVVLFAAGVITSGGTLSVVVAVGATIALGGVMTFGTMLGGMMLGYAKDEMFGQSANRQGGGANITQIPGWPSGFRNFFPLAHRKFETLEDALQPLTGAIPGNLSGFKILQLSGTIYVKRLHNTSPFIYTGRGVIVSDDPGQPLLTGPIGPMVGADAPATSGTSSDRSEYFSPAFSKDNHLTIVHYRGLKEDEIDKGKGAVRLGAHPSARLKIPGFHDPVGSAAEPPRDTPTPAYFHLSLFAESGAVPDPGESGRPKVTNAILRGNYVCGLLNKRQVAEDSALHVVYDPSLRDLTDYYVGTLSGAPVQVHH